MNEVQLLTAKQDSAIMAGKEIVMQYTVHGKMRMYMKSPELRRYIEADGTSYSDFPKGVYIEFFDDNGVKTSSLKANYSIYYESDGVWEAKYDVIAINDKGERLNTEYLKWYQNEERISSNKFVTMTTEDGVIYGDGFESNQDFSSWEVINGRGIINVETDE